MTVLIRTGTPKRENRTSDRRPAEAVPAIGGVLNPADLIEPPQLPVSKLSKVPARTLSVEAVMDLASEILWPEVGHEQPVEIDEFGAHRAQEYSLLAMLLSRSPDAAMLNRIAKLRGDATPLGLAHLALAQAAGNASAERSRASTSPFSLELDAASCFSMDHTISPAFSMNGRWRDCARISARTASNAPKDKWNPRTMPPFFARSCPVWPVVNFQ